MRRGLWIVGTVVVVASALNAAKVASMPMFARQMGTECQTCHTTIPKLNEVGMKFRTSGFRDPDEIGTQEKDPNNVGNQMSTRIQTRYDAARTTKAKGPGGSIAPDTKTSQLHFFELTFYPITGAFNKNFSSLCELSIVPEDFIEIENAYIRGDWKAGKGVFESRVGIFHPFEGYGASDRALSITRPLLQTAVAKDSANSYPFTPWNFDQSGLEVGYMQGHTIVTATVFNGLVYDAAEGKAFPAQGGALVKNAGLPSTGNKDVQLFLTQMLTDDGGGASVYFYSGALDLPAGGNTFQDAFTRAAGYASYPVAKRLMLLAGYQQGSDKARKGLVETTSKSTGYFGQADVKLKHNYNFAGRYDWFDPSDKAQKDRLQAFTLAMNKPFENGLQLMAEFQHKLSEQQGSQAGGAAYSEKQADSFQLRGIWIW